MYGPSRANFHGVPRILENTLPSYLKQSNNNDPDWNIYAEYMSTSRINVNVRQVF
nr:14090_t:CDS:2 [Entrophospora candida]